MAVAKLLATVMVMVCASQANSSLSSTEDSSDPSAAEGSTDDGAAAADNAPLLRGSVVQELVDGHRSKRVFFEAVQHAVIGVTLLVFAGILWFRRSMTPDEAMHMLKETEIAAFNESLHPKKPIEMVSVNRTGNKSAKVVVAETPGQNPVALSNTICEVPAGKSHGSVVVLPGVGTRAASDIATLFFSNGLADLRAEHQKLAKENKDDGAEADADPAVPELSTAPPSETELNDLAAGLQYEMSRILMSLSEVKTDATCTWWEAREDGRYDVTVAAAGGCEAVVFGPGGDASVLQVLQNWRPLSNKGSGGFTVASSEGVEAGSLVVMASARVIESLGGYAKVATSLQEYAAKGELDVAVELLTRRAARKVQDEPVCLAAVVLDDGELYNGLPMEMTYAGDYPSVDDEQRFFYDLFAQKRGFNPDLRPASAQTRWYTKDSPW